VRDEAVKGNGASEVKIQKVFVTITNEKREWRKEGKDI